VMGEISDILRARAEEHTRLHLCNIESMDALIAVINDDKVGVVCWCQERNCGDIIEEKTNASILGTDVRSTYIQATEGACIACGKPGKATLVGRAY
jgi:prolyl-tRNA synthetase